MKKIDLKPTTENILNMLKNDFINRNDNIKNFIEMIDYLDENTSISINGEWGTGKTFFVKQIIEILIYKNKLIEEKNKKDYNKIQTILNSTNSKLENIELVNDFVPIYYNAWDNDSHSDPILSLIFHIVKEGKLDGYGKISKSTFEKIVSIADIFNIWSSGSLTKCVETFKSEDITNEIITIENAKKILKELLNESIVEKGSKLIIFIDELDRCNPIYAVKLLERIKHFFDDDRIIFVFSTNINQLTNTISNYYGSNFDSFKYLNKFFDISFDLKNVDNTKYIENLGYKQSSYYFDNTVFEMTNYYNFSMRDCNRYIQSINIVRDFVHIQRDGFKDNRGYQTLLMFYVPILLALKIVDIQNFIKVISGEGYNIFEKIVLDNSKTYEGLRYRMRRNEQGKIVKDDYKVQLLEMYNTIFNNNGSQNYESNEIIFDNDSKRELMEVVSLLKKGLNYK